MVHTTMHRLLLPVDDLSIESVKFIGIYCNFIQENVRFSLKQKKFISMSFMQLMFCDKFISLKPCHHQVNYNVAFSSSKLFKAFLPTPKVTMICSSVETWFLVLESYSPFDAVMNLHQFILLHLIARNLLDRLSLSLSLSLQHSSSFQWWKFIKCMDESEMIVRETREGKAEQTHPQALCITHFRHVPCTLFHHLSSFFLCASKLMLKQKHDERNY